MAWSAPMTAVAGAVFTAAQFNQYVRDNLGVSGPALATTRNSMLVGNGLNQVVMRKPVRDVAPDGTTTTSLTYTDLIEGPAPTVSLATGVKAMVWIYCNMYNTLGNAIWMSVEVSGATTLAADDSRAIQLTGTDADRCGAGFLLDLTGGNNTFTAKYRVSGGGIGYYSGRRLVVWPF